jgi:hypothetical protein
MPCAQETAWIADVTLLGQLPFSLVICAGSRSLAETPLKTQLKFQATQVVGAKRAYGSHFGV